MILPHPGGYTTMLNAPVKACCGIVPSRTCGGLLHSSEPLALHKQRPHIGADAACRSQQSSAALYCEEQDCKLML